MNCSFLPYAVSAVWAGLVWLSRKWKHGGLLYFFHSTDLQLLKYLQTVDSSRRCGSFLFVHSVLVMHLAVDNKIMPKLEEAERKLC